MLVILVVDWCGSRRYQYYIKRYFSNDNRIVTISCNRISTRRLNFAVCFLDSDVNLISRGRSSVSKPLIVLQQSVAHCIETCINVPFNSNELTIYSFDLTVTHSSKFLSGCSIVMCFFANCAIQMCDIWSNSTSILWFLIFTILNSIRKLHFAVGNAFRPLTPALLTRICFAFSFRAYLLQSCPLFLLTHPFSPHVSHVFTFYINNLVRLSFALQNMDIAKASERLLKLAVSIYIHIFIHGQICKRVPGVK